ncbi:hypothetical protein [Exiguobacterium alkaliphilum]|uniref:Uncharacterized protein n=1 Tax=Exiguobacterium alkaliphilum TaxID=1428684 RepID=A0ABT2KZ25_9BACL|nr:hypothetical protein [Exiguobacterium alkaliphilum]MCT4795726.1 hypothetical protein [Exiguobacterium alkaliphilum]
MRKQEEGYVLVLVLVTMAALAVLSLAAMQVNLVTNKLTVIRTEDTQLNEDARSALQLIAADVRNRFPLHDSNDVPEHMASETAFNAAVHELLATDAPFVKLTNTSDSTITYSIQLKEDEDTTQLVTAPFTKILQVDVRASRQVNPEQPRLAVHYTQDLYLTALPSFLYYVLGSDQQLAVNGMPTVKGNIYSGGPFTLMRPANYQLNGEAKQLQNLSTSRFYLDGRIDVPDLASCNVCRQPNYFTAGNSFANEFPDAGPVTSQFSPFQFDYSIIEFVNRRLAQKLPYTNTVEATLFKQSTLPRTNLVFETERVISDDGSTIIERPSPYLVKRLYDRLNDPTIVTLPPALTGSAMVITESIAKNENPLLFDGDLTIDSLNHISIDRPLIVNGDLTIQGNVSFESTVYVLGDSVIDRANIRPLDETGLNSLVLLSKGKILLNRINEFETGSTSLQAFLYSDSLEKTQVYAVGSELQIKGGLYSRGPLDVNVFRGRYPEAEGLSATQYFERNIPEQAPEHSRLQLTYNDAVFNQLNTLPVTNQLQFFVSQPVQLQ